MWLFDCRLDIFLCELWTMLPNIKFDWEDEPPVKSVPSLWERVWEKGKMKLKCLLKLCELFLKDTRIMSQENTAPLRTQACPVCMFNSALLHC